MAERADDEKKELKKIEQKPTKCSEKTEEQESVKSFNIYEKSLLEKFKKAVYDCAWGKVTCKVEGESKEEYAERWSEQFLLMTRDWADDYIDFTIAQKERRIYDNGYKDALKNLNAAWSEEDEKFLNVAINILNSSKVYTKSPDKYEDTINWLKSLKERYTWKPSEEMLNALAVVCFSHSRPELCRLYEQLKEL